VNPAAAFFFTVLALQAVFTAAMVLLVGRRFPARLKVYRLVAPAAVPTMLFALVAFAAVSNDAASGPNLARIFLSDLLLWLVGVLFASLVIRLSRR
jgi:hypothetical protein